MRGDVGQEVVFILCFLLGLGVLLVLMTYLEATLDRPRKPARRRLAWLKRGPVRAPTSSRTAVRPQDTRS
jgi:hypothetical protein